MDMDCAVCGVPAPALCSRCRAVAYCGPDCQKAHWRFHRTTCTTASSCAGARNCVGEADSAPAGVSCNGMDEARAAQMEVHDNGASTAAPFDVVLMGQRSVEKAQQIVDTLRQRGVCVIKAGADPDFQQALRLETQMLWDVGHFGAAKKGRVETPGGDVRFEPRDDRIVWLNEDWVHKHGNQCRALMALNQQLTDFGMGLNKLLEEQLCLRLERRTVGMLACYDGNLVPGARYDLHVDNPYQTAMKCPDDKRRLTVMYYMNEGPWDVQKDGGGLQVCLTNPRRAPLSATEAVASPKLTVAPEMDTLVVFFSHTMYHAVAPVSAGRKRFALSAWFQGA